MGKLWDMIKNYNKKTEQENRCPNCNYLLSKNLKGQVQVKCRKCKRIIELKEN